MSIRKFITIDILSTYRDNPSTTKAENMTVSNIHIPEGWKNYYVSPSIIEVPITFYAVRDGRDLFQISENGGSSWTNIVLPHGNYSFDSFIDELQLKINDAGLSHTYTVSSGSTENVETGKIIISVDGIVVSPQPKIRFPDSRVDSGNQFYELLGFNYWGEQYVDGAIYSFNNNSLISPNICQLNPESYLFIHSNIVGMTDISNPRTADLIFALPVRNAVLYSSSFYESSDLLINAKPLAYGSSSYTFKITDEWNNIVPLNGIDYFMRLIVFERETGFETVENFIKYIVQKDIINEEN